ncbi:MAG: GatB/YqeY domain-containing protein [Longimicrobiales bacterium]
MAGLKERLKADVDAARRARDRERTGLLSMTLAEVRNREIELGREATDADVLELIGRAIKRRREAAEQMRVGDRAELAEREEREAEALTGYLPAQLDEADVRELVRDAIADGAADIGAVMGRIMPHLKGRFDGREANRIAREELAR